MEYLSQNRFQILTIDDAIDVMIRKKRIQNGRPLSLTFDNGYFDFYENALPILEEYDFPVTLLICPSRTGESVTIAGQETRYLDWETLRKIIKSNITIGAFEDHTWNINTLPKELLHKHITEYKKIIEDQLGITVQYFGIKEGVPSLRTREHLISEGYRAFLTECPTNKSPDLYSIGRIQVDDDDFNIFLTKISRTYLFFKDRRSWKYIREYSLDKVAHRVSETFDRIRGITDQ